VHGIIKNTIEQQVDVPDGYQVQVGYEVDRTPGAAFALPCDELNQVFTKLARGDKSAVPPKMSGLHFTGDGKTLAGAHLLYSFTPANAVSNTDKAGSSDELFRPSKRKKVKHAPAATPALAAANPSNDIIAPVAPAAPMPTAAAATAQHHEPVAMSAQPTAAASQLNNAGSTTSDAAGAIIHTMAKEWHPMDQHGRFYRTNQAETEHTALMVSTTSHAAASYQEPAHACQHTSNALQRWIIKDVASQAGLDNKTAHKMYFKYVLNSTRSVERYYDLH
jgi:hypothetical protein